MNYLKLSIIVLFSTVIFTSCVTKKRFAGLQSELEATKADLQRRGDIVNDFKNKLVACEQEKEKMANNQVSREEQVRDLKAQVDDLKKVRDLQMQQVGGLTVLNQSANENINRTLSQMEKKDRYITQIQAARNKADSMNLALAINLTSVLKDGIEDNDVDIKIDKTVVMVNLSDKMLFNSGSYKITNRADEVLGKLAKIIASRPDLEMMVEGYTDNVKIHTNCIDDNWDLSVKRATSVVKELQGRFGVDPNRMIAAGRGEYNILASNDTAAGRATNRRTRIILMPKLDQFYDLLNPDNVK